MEIKDDLELSRSNLCDQAKEHINENDVILTCSYSNSMVQFFKEAKKTIKFELVILETAPSFSGHRLAKELAKAGIKCNLV